MNRIIVSYILILLLGLTMTACGNYGASVEGTVELEERVIETIMNNQEEGVFNQQDIVIDRIYCGSFSQADKKEAFVVFKILGTSHVGGLGRKEGVIVDLTSLEVIAYRSFPYDEVCFSCLENSNEQTRILMIGTVTYQGISTQDVCLLGIAENEWVNLPLMAVEEMLDEEHFFYASEDSLLVTYMHPASEKEVVLEELTWDPWTEQFAEACDRFDMGQ